jgi:pyruvate/2-oxoacid:ferredoxin oxidoreductase beta subunit
MKPLTDSCGTCTSGVDVMRSGYAACPVGGQAISMRLVLRVVGRRAIVVTVPSCVSVIAGPFPTQKANHGNHGCPA